MSVLLNLEAAVTTFLTSYARFWPASSLGVPHYKQMAGTGILSLHMRSQLSTRTRYRTSTFNDASSGLRHNTRDAYFISKFPPWWRQAFHPGLVLT